MLSVDSTVAYSQIKLKEFKQISNFKAYHPFLAQRILPFAAMIWRLFDIHQSRTHPNSCESPIGQKNDTRSCYSNLGQ